MKYNFDETIDRHGSFCTQWDFVEDRFGKKDVIPFTISDSDFKVAQPILTALETTVSHGIFGYTRWNHSAFKDAIYHWYHSRFDVAICQDDILYGPSVMYMIKTVIALHLQTDSQPKIIVQNPSYDGFTKLIDGLNLKRSSWQLNEGSLDFEDFEALCKKNHGGIFLLCNPHNPTGRCFTKSELLEMVQICRKHEIFIISDEIHMDYVYLPHHHTPIIEIAKKLNYLDKVALITSASKTFNTAGLQGAYMLLPNKAMKIDYLHILREIDCLSSASVMGVQALIAAYTESEDWLDEMLTYLETTFTWIENYIKKNKLPIVWHKPQATYFAWLDMKDFGLAESELQTALLEKNIAIMGGSYYLEGQGNYLRINIAAPLSKIKLALKALKEIHEENKKT